MNYDTRHHRGRGGVASSRSFLTASFNIELWNIIRSRHD
jgi:hypothetical protein